MGCRSIASHCSQLQANVAMLASPNLLWYLLFFGYECRDIIREVANRHICSCTCVDIFKLYHQQLYNFSRLSEGQKIKILDFLLRKCILIPRDIVM